MNLASVAQLTNASMVERLPEDLPRAGQGPGDLYNLEAPNDTKRRLVSRLGTV